MGSYCRGPSRPIPREAMEHSAAVLAVDDDPTVLSALKRLLRQERVPVLTSGCGAEALALLAQRSDGIGAVISDYAMPDMNGADLLRDIRLQWPDITRVLLTGKADLATAARAVNEGQVARFFSKPWEAHEIRRGLIEALEQHYRLREERQQQAQAAAREQARVEREQALGELTQALATNVHETRTLHMIAR